MLPSEEQTGWVKTFFDRDVTKRGMKPLKDGIEIALYVDDKGPMTLGKKEGTPYVDVQAPLSAHLSFWIPSHSAKSLSELQTEDLGELGVAILKLMANPDPGYRIRARVHIGLFEFLRSGYLGVLPLGGSTVMKFLASRGFSGIGKIREAISRLREK